MNNQHLLTEDQLETLESVFEGELTEQYSIEELADLLDEDKAKIEQFFHLKPVKLKLIMDKARTWSVDKIVEKLKIPKLVV